MSRLANLVLPHFNFDAAPMPSEWAESNLVIPKKMSPNSPGQFSLDSRPWARFILDKFHPDSGARRCDVAIAVQMAKTTLMTVGCAYRCNFAPVPIMIVGGMSASFAKREISENRLHPLFNSNEVLRTLKLHDPHQFRGLEMNLAFNRILVTGAGSDTNLAGSTQGIVCIDEASKIEHQHSTDAPEAHPIRLAEDRTKDFLGHEFIWKSSTPNSHNHIFWKDVEDGSFDHLFVPCPHCKEYFPFEFESRKGSEIATPGELEQTAEEGKPAEYRSVIWSGDARNADGTWSKSKIRESAHYVCPHNGCKIVDSDKPAMMRAFEPESYNKKADPSRFSIRVPSFYSPKRTFADLAIGFVDRGDLLTTGLQVFFNHELAKPWEDIDLKLKDEDLWKCKAEADLSYMRGFLPPVKIKRLIAAADPGQKETHWGVGAVDIDENIYMIDWGTVLSIPDLLAIRHQWNYCRAGHEKNKARPSFGIVDSGDFTSEVYKMCQRSGSFWWPSKGSDATTGEWGKSVLKNYPGLMLYTYVDKVAKDELYDLRIRRRQDRRFFFPSNVDPAYIAGYSGQERIDRGVRARWKKVRHDHDGDVAKGIQLGSWIISNRRIRGDDAPIDRTGEP